MSKIVLVALIINSLVIALPAGAQPLAVDRPTWSIGDTWTYRQGSTMLTLTVLGVTENGYVAQFKTPSSEIVHPTRDLLWDNSIWFHPQWPLVPGNKWTFKTQSTAGNDIGGVNTYEVTESVIGEESITVPAGTFQSVHIHGRQCNTTQQNRCGDFDVWYAPRVKYTVKISLASSSYWSGPWVRELVSYQVHTP